MSDAILVLNVGSSSIRFSLFRADQAPIRQSLVCEGKYQGIGHRVQFKVGDAAGTVLVEDFLDAGTSHEDALAALLDWLKRHFKHERIVAVGHRVVHGGMSYVRPIRIHESVITELRRLIPLAPLHQPHSLAAMAAVSRSHPGLVQVACFDTGFHRTQSAVATTFALPYPLRAEGIRRYGFHGLSYEYIAGVLPDFLGPIADGRVIVAHLGNGASMCALYRRKSVATTMGFTALAGLPMSCRCGDLDPGVILYLLQEKGMTVAEVSHLLYWESGLLGVSGISDDMQTLLASNEDGAETAISLFTYRIGRETGSLAAALGGLDALVFTAGIGEHSADIRRRACEQSAWLGVEIDEQANVAGGPRITTVASKVSAWVIPTNEELVIARHTWQLVASGT